jgi:hypothetical protein
LFFGAKFPLICLSEIVYGMIVRKELGGGKQMKTFLFTGDILHPGTIKVMADTVEEAEEKIERYDFEVYDEQGSDLAFEHNGEEPEILED